MGRHFRRPGDDRGARRPARPPLPPARDERRQLPLQGRPAQERSRRRLIALPLKHKEAPWRASQGASCLFPLGIVRSSRQASRAVSLPKPTQLVVKPLTPDDFRYQKRRGEKARKMLGDLAQLPAIATSLKLVPLTAATGTFLLAISTSSTFCCPIC